MEFDFSTMTMVKSFLFSFLGPGVFDSVLGPGVPSSVLGPRIARSVLV